MSFLKKILVGAGIVTGVAFLFRLKRTDEELDTQTAVTVQKLDLSGLFLQINITLKNPTRTGFKVKFPYVKVLYRNSLIGSSQVKDVDLEIPSFGQTNASNIIIQIPLAKLVSVGAALTNLLKNGTPLNLQVETISTIAGNIPYKRVDEINLKLPSHAG